MRRRILFSNFTLAGGSGTEAFLWDLTGGLQARGWECGIYTPRPGPLAEAFRQRGIPVWHDLDEVTFQPEVLHCQHTMESLALRDRFPGIPALFMVHDGRSRHDTTPGLAGWAALVAVDDFCRQRIIRETGLGEEQIEVIHNSVDTRRFLPRSPLPEIPRRAAIFTSNAVNNAHVLAARSLFGKLGIALDELGPGAGNPVADPENWLPRYDLVLAKGRCAQEAMAVGAAVILIGAEGTGEMVTPENFAAFKQRNFGLSLLRPGMDQDFLEQQVQRYSADRARQVQELLRTTCGLDGMVEAFIQLYESLPARGRPFAGRPDVLPVAAVASWCGSLLREHAGLWVQHTGAQRGAPCYKQELAAAQAKLVKQRERAEHYRNEARKYKARAAGLKAKPARKGKERKSLWARLWTRGAPEVHRARPTLPVPFLVGAPRSGSTLLRMMLDANSQLAIPPETGFLTGIREQAGHPCTVERVVEWMTTYPAGQAPVWNDFQMSRDSLEKALRGLPALNLAEAVGCFYRLYASGQNKPRWGDKTPGYAQHMEAIRALIPESKFIHLIRDGRDVALSLRAQPFSPGPTMTDQAKLWMEMTAAARRSAEGLGGCMEVRYEQLVRDPEPVLREICVFLELPFEPGMLHPEQRAEARLLEHEERVAPGGRVVLTKAERRNIWHHSAKAVDARMAGQWREKLTIEEIAEFEETAGRWLGELGYPLFS
ncbi:MAG: sulfotransferase [Verrucomicrobiota bacterium]